MHSKLALVLSLAALAMLACSGEQKISKPVQTSDTGQTASAAKIASNPTRNVYFGDMHIHTANSMDAYVFDVRTTPDQAYRYAQGEALPHPAGFDIQIKGGPLDFFAVTDHAEYLGVFPDMDDPESKYKDHPAAKISHYGSYGRRQKELFKFFSQGPEELLDPEVMNAAWRKTIEAAEKHNQPGKFTTFSAFEFSARGPGQGLSMLHRNVIFKDAAPDEPFSSINSHDPEDLWDWLDDQRANGIDGLAIPHNPNLSAGHSLKLETYDGDPLSIEYAQQRMRNEPLVEITQIKGTSETHPLLSPNDEWSNFEIMENFIPAPPYTSAEQAKGNYVRNALKEGLKREDAQGYNPFEMGVIGSSDTHLGAMGYQESNYKGKFGLGEFTAQDRGSVASNIEAGWTAKELKIPSEIKFGAGGLTGVWAESNTRESIFSALRRKETFATTGPRMKLRFFAGLDYDASLSNDNELLEKAYAKGVPMGSDLIGDGRNAQFFVWAQRDANDAPLQRVQIIKLTGTTEQVFDVACAKGEPDAATHRCPDNGASVDIKSCTAKGEGAAELKALWTDPSFDPTERSSYYVRVLQNPTCRWSSYDAMRNGVAPRTDVAATIQERAYSSAIWYTPVKN